MPCLGLATREPQLGDAERGAVGTEHRRVGVNRCFAAEPAFGLECQHGADVARIIDLNLIPVCPGAGGTGAVVKVVGCDMMPIVVFKSQEAFAYRDD